MWVWACGRDSWANGSRLVSGGSVAAFHIPPHSRTRFNAAVATLVLEHVEALGPAFREARRVLRDGGTFYLAELHPYRQFDGTQTHVEDETTGETVVIDAFTHSVSEFVNTGVEAGFAVQQMREWWPDRDETPRLSTIRFGAGPVVAGA